MNDIFRMVLTGACTAACLTVSAAQEFGPGGPLAGVNLPLLQTQHGEPPGYPGALPEILGGKTVDGEGNSLLTAPELLLYPGAVEHYRNYWFKYCPVRSFFDQQSQLKLWTAPNIPGSQKGQLESYASPVYFVPRHLAPTNTGRKLPPVSVVRANAAGPVFQLNLGELDVGVYAVRVVGAVETGQLKSMRLPLFLRMTVNDGLGGETNAYRIRIGYVDEFYSVAELYFHAPSKRAYRAELKVDAGSAADLLVHDIVLDDALAGSVRGPIKTCGALYGLPIKPPAEIKTVKVLTGPERLERDAAIWNSFPRINLQPGVGTPENGFFYQQPDSLLAGSSNGLPPDVVRQYGHWELVLDGVTFMTNDTLKLAYSIDDMQHQRPLPDPYPFKDDGTGVTWTDPKTDGAKGRIWTPVGNVVAARWKGYAYPNVMQSIEIYETTGKPDALRDAAIYLARWAYAYPSVDSANMLYFLVHGTTPYGRENRCRRRQSSADFLRHYPEYFQPILQYDRLFDYLKDNQEVASSIGRFVPWVKTPRDVITLFDVYLVQTTAKRIMRYHYYTEPMYIANIAIVAGNPKVADPWMEWLFSQAFIYPFPPSGIQDAMISSICRDGCEYIGSTYYAQLKGGLRVGESLNRYIQSGGNRKFDMGDPGRFPKALAQCNWQYAQVVAGWDGLRIGDVRGPDKEPGSTLSALYVDPAATQGWAWSKDPRFAFVLKHYVGRKGQSDAEWTEIEKAALLCRRAPWLENRSRAMPMWATVLESGLTHDDYRFRTAAYVRTGYGYGHQHADTLDLQVVAHGLPATIDGGQRSGYANPADASTKMHNVVLVDESGHHAYSWTRSLVDAEGARYAEVRANPPATARLTTRQVALIDADPGRGSQNLTPEKQYPDPNDPWAKLPKDVVTPNSYVFDVCRTAGGSNHTYAFHAMVNDDFQWNANGTVPAAEPMPGNRLIQNYSKPEMKFQGKVADIFQATWRQARKADGKSVVGTEEAWLGRSFDTNSPRRYTRLHLFDMSGATALRAQAWGIQLGYDYTVAYVQKRGDAVLESAFPAVIEPYVGEPFIAGRRQLKVEDNDADALKGVAVQLTMTNGSVDVCFADGRPEKRRRLPEVDMTVAGEFGYCSTDKQGLRQATLAGGTRLTAPGMELTAALGERTGRITRVDYLKKTLWIDQPWPARLDGGLIEAGIRGHRTAYMVRTVKPEGKTAAITVQNGADYFRSRVVEVDVETGIVKTGMEPLLKTFPDNSSGWMASDDESRTFWRAEYLGNCRFKLTGAPVSKEALGKAGVLRLWEYGPGDDIRQATFVSLRRLEPGLFELTGDIDVTVALPAKSMEISTDAQTWKPAKTMVSGDLLKLTVSAEQLSEQGRVLLRIR